MTDRWTVRMTDDWLPLPAELLSRLGWQEGDEIEIEVVGTSLILSRTSSVAAPESNRGK